MNSFKCIFCYVIVSFILAFASDLNVNAAEAGQFEDIFLDSGEVIMPTYEGTSSPEFDTDVGTPIYQGGNVNTSANGGNWYPVGYPVDMPFTSHLFQFSSKYVFDVEKLENYVYLCTFDNINQPTQIYTVLFDTESIQSSVYANRYIMDSDTNTIYRSESHPYININNPTALNKIKTLGIASQGGNVTGIWYISSTNWSIPKFEDYKTSKVLWFKDESDLVSYAETQDVSLIINKLDIPWYDDSLINESIPNPRLSFKNDVISIDNFSQDYLVEVRGSYRYINNVTVLYDSSNKVAINYNSVDRTHFFFISHKDNFASDKIRLKEDVFVPHQPFELNADTNIVTGGIVVNDKLNADGSHVKSLKDIADSLKDILTIKSGSSLGKYNFIPVQSGSDFLTGRAIVPDLYIRFVKKNGNDIQYSTWTHFTLGLTPSGNSSNSLDSVYYSTNDSGLSSSELNDLYEDGVYRGDDKLEVLEPEKIFNFSNPSSGGFLSGLSDVSSLVTNAVAVLQTSISYIGNVPAMISKVFVFLPVWLRNLMYSCVSFTCIVGVIRVLRG